MNLESFTGCLNTVGVVGGRLKFKSLFTVKNRNVRSERMRIGKQQAEIIMCVCVYVCVCVSMCLYMMVDALA